MFLHQVVHLDAALGTAVERVLGEHRSGRLHAPAAQALRAANASLGAASLDGEAASPVMVLFGEPRPWGEALCLPMRWSCPAELRIALDADLVFRPRDARRTEAELRGVLRPDRPLATAATAYEIAEVGSLVVSAILPGADRLLYPRAAGHSARSMAHTSRPPSKER